jgi:cbb3-type cytochrome oxidase maturation protein
VSFLLVTIPVSLLLAGALVALVIHAVRTGAMDDWDGPALRMIQDDDRNPELDRSVSAADATLGEGGEQRLLAPLVGGHAGDEVVE